jgi:voltage-gated potassium channel
VKAVVRTLRGDVESHCVTPLQARLQRFFDVATAIAAVLTLPVVVVLALDPPSGLHDALDVLNWCLWGTFVAELVTMLAVSRDRSGWLRRRPLTPVIVALTVPVFNGLDLFRLVRLLRGRVAHNIADSVTSEEGLRNVALLTLLTVGLGGVLFARVEPDVGVGDGLYWAVTTVTTVGYGDVVPTTDAGKVLAVYVMLIGAAFLAILTGAIAQRFVLRWQAAAQQAPAAGDAPGGDGGQEAVLAKLDDLGERLAALERALSRKPG